MGFSGIGIWEILVILVVILLVLGPNRLPEMARKMGQAIRAIRKASAELTTTLSREMEADEKKPQPPKPGLTENIPPPAATAAKKPAASKKTPAAAKKPRTAAKKPRAAAKKPPQAPGEAPGKP